jgi:bacillithiol system protein YtxJ
MRWFKDSNFDWIDILNLGSLDELINSSFENKVLLFKHSTRCSISSLAKSRIESAYDNKKIKNCYLLDLLAFRDLSNKISSDFNINHESPQVLIIEKGKCIAHLSHGDISWDNIV